MMYFSFDQEKSAVRNNFDNSVEDKSGHFNDASFSDRAHTSSRAYGRTCYSYKLVIVCFETSLKGSL